MVRFSASRAKALGVGLSCGVVALAASFAISPAVAGRSASWRDAAKACSGPTPCFQRQNAGNGPAILGASAGGNGVVGHTTFFSASSGAAGVLGADLATPNPNGTPLNNAGVSGTSTAGTGVFGQATTGIGVRGTATTGDGMVASASGGDGIFGTTLSNELHVSSAGVFGEDVGSSSNAAGVIGFSRTGIGVQGDNFEVGANLNAAMLGLTFSSQINTYFPAHPTGGLFNSDTGEGLVAETSGAEAEALSAANFGGGPIMRGYAGKTEVLEVDNAGNLVISGKLTQHGNPGAIAHTSGVGDVVMYAPTEAAATVEDVGEARLAAGQAYVRIDPRFGSTMLPGGSYLVFLTPQGDTNGLYVSQKSASGFLVREHAGQSNVAFDYRIVGQPYGERGSRLPAAPRAPVQTFLRSHTTHRSDVLLKQGLIRT